tara:strand:- start:2820 stop:3905 length:1086 start_codon:yes stop_codon:yes gene_type:complete
MLEVNIAGEIGTLQMRANFSSQSGHITALLGRSGSGKSTIINMIAGLLTPQTGLIKIDQETFFDSSHRINLPPEKRRVGYVFQDNRLFPHMSVQRNLFYGKKLANKKSRQLEESEIIDLLDLQALLERRPYNLSGGEQKRVALGRALLSSPSILLMDEPMAGLDLQRKLDILPFIEKINRHFNLPIIYVSHDLDEVIRLADEAGLVIKGAINGLKPVEHLTDHAQFHEIVSRENLVTILQGEAIGTQGKSGLNEVKTPAGLFLLPRSDLPKGTKLRLRLNATDISIATEKPRNLSILNVIPGSIASIQEVEQATVSIAIQTATSSIIHAQITKHACESLSLKEGKSIFALVKSVAIDRFDQ